MPSALQIVQKFFPGVKTVVDAERNARIEVTSKDEATSRKKSHKGCAMAVACKRKFHLDGVIISVNRAYLVKGDRARRFQLPPSVSREVVSFDRGGGFEPGDYELSKVGEGTKLGVSRNIKSNGSKHSHVGATAKMSHKTGGVRVALGSKAAVE